MRLISLTGSFTRASAAGRYPLLDLQRADRPSQAHARLLPADRLPTANGRTGNAQSVSFQIRADPHADIECTRMHVLGKASQFNHFWALWDSDNETPSYAKDDVRET